MSQEENKDTEKVEEKTQSDKNVDKPEQPEPLAGFQIQLQEDGQITRRFFGKQQNVATMYGLIEVIKSEVKAMASGMPGQTPNRDQRLLSNLVGGVTNIANVLVGLQAGLNQLKKQVEEMVNDKSEPELEDSSRETLPTEGSGE